MTNPVEVCAAVKQGNEHIMRAEQLLLPVAAGICFDSSTKHRNRRLSSWSISLPLIGSFLALSLLPFMQPQLEIWLLFLGAVMCSMLGVTIGFHRYFTHRAFKTYRVCALALGLLGTCAMQGPIDRWVADHRRHHRFPDAPGDPHSPYFDSDGRPVNNRLAGLFHAHVGWILEGYGSSHERYASDILADPMLMWLSKYYWYVNIAGLAVFALAGFFLTADVKQAMLAALWAGCVRISVGHQFTWAVNSIGHCYGSRVKPSSDRSTNNWVVTLLTFGEGLHSSHHRNPLRAVNEPVYLDSSGLFLLCLERIGVIWQVRR